VTPKKKKQKRDYYHKNKLSWRRYELKKRYGITLEDYDKLLKDQQGKCAICRRSPVRNRLHVDHDHRTLKVRGLLCTRCNGDLGWFEKFSRRIADYLKGVPLGEICEHME
jgi:hypothetical protein